MVEEWKWELSVWSHDGIICTGETDKAVVNAAVAANTAGEKKT